MIKTKNYNIEGVRCDTIIQKQPEQTNWWLQWIRADPIIANCAFT